MSYVLSTIIGIKDTAVIKAEEIPGLVELIFWGRGQIVNKINNMTYNILCIGELGKAYAEKRDYRYLGWEILDRVAKNDLPIKMTFGRCPERSEEAGCVVFRRRVV